MDRAGFDLVDPRTWYGVRRKPRWRRSVGKLELLAVVVDRRLTSRTKMLGPDPRRSPGLRGGGARSRCPLCAFALLLRFRQEGPETEGAPALLHALIHPTSEKGCSPTFATRGRCPREFWLWPSGVSPLPCTSPSTTSTPPRGRTLPREGLRARRGGRRTLGPLLGDAHQPRPECDRGGGAHSGEVISVMRAYTSRPPVVDRASAARDNRWGL